MKEDEMKKLADRLRRAETPPPLNLLNEVKAEMQRRGINMPAAPQSAPHRLRLIYLEVISDK